MGLTADIPTLCRENPVQESGRAGAKAPWAIQEGPGRSTGSQGEGGAGDSRRYRRCQRQVRQKGEEGAQVAALGRRRGPLAVLPPACSKMRGGGSMALAQQPQCLHVQQQQHLQQPAVRCFLTATDSCSKGPCGTHVQQWQAQMHCTSSSRQCQCVSTCSASS